MDRTWVWSLMCKLRFPHFFRATKPMQMQGEIQHAATKTHVVQSLSWVQFFATHGQQHTRFPCPSPSPGACSNSCPLSRWCHPTISSSVIPISSCLQPFPASGSFPISQLFTPGSAFRIRWPKYWSFSFSIDPSNEYSRLISLGSTGLISLQSKRLSRIFSSTTVWMHQFFSAQPSLWSNAHIHTWFLEKP